MSTAKPRALLRIEYGDAAQAYLRSLPLEHFMEATPQGKQREITMESLALVCPHRPDLHYFNELLIQYPHGRPSKIRQVVPDNLVVLHDGAIEAMTSFDLPLQPAGPFWVLEYISQNSKRKDYEEGFAKYERELKVPYLLHFYPDNDELALYHHTGKRYRTVRPNEHGRYAVPELDIEVGLLDGWVRFWYKGQLLPLPAELQRELEEMRRQLIEANRRADEATRRADEEARRAENERQLRVAAEEQLARLRAQLEQAQNPRKKRP